MKDYLGLVLEPMIDLYIWEIQQAGGPFESDRAWARAIGEQLAYTGDAYQWKGEKSAGGKPPTKGQVARALAIGAFNPSGLELFGRHWKPMEGR